MKLRSVALVGVVCLAALGLIGVGARAVFTTSTTSGQTITAATNFTSTTAPSVTVTYPVNDTTYGADWTGTITGTASSNSGAGTTIKDTLVAVEDTTTTTWWDGTSFGASAQSFTATSGTPSNWTLPLTASDLTSGNSYAVIAQATDSLANIGTSATVTFTYDTAAPTVIVTYPMSTQYNQTTWGNQISGTALSNSGTGTTIATTAVAIEDVSTHSWWNESAFAATSQTFVPVTGTTTWSLVFAADNLTSGDSYSVIGEATDSAGNLGTNTPVAFTYCNHTTKIPPTVAITYPANGATYGATSWNGAISGTASSNSGPGTTITAVAVSIEDTATKQWWNGSSFGSGTQTFAGASGHTTWLFGLPALDLTSGVTYSAIAQATDSAGNVGTSSPVSFTYCVRTAAPSVAITYPVNNTSYGANWTGEITGTAATNAGVGTTITGVSVAIQDVKTGEWWTTSTGFTSSSQDFSAANGFTTWNLPFPISNLTSGVSYNVIAQATDSLKNLGTSTTVRFTYCNRTTKTPPTVVITYPVNNATYGTTWTGQFTGTASAATGATISKTLLSIEDTTTKFWWNGSAFADSSASWFPVTGATTWIYTMSSGLTSNNTYAATAKATDNLGNTGTSPTVSFTYATPPPTVTISYPVNKAAYGTNWTGSITGTSSTNSGPATSITGVTVAVENTTTGRWLLGTSFTDGSQSFQTASGTTKWSFALPARYLVSGNTYGVTVKATDSVGNTSTSSQVAFTFNSSAPSVAINYPVNNATYGSTNWIGTITGTASSNSGTGTTIVSISVAIQNTKTKKWWNGSSFSALSRTFVTVTGTTSWSLLLPSKYLSSWGSYTVVAEATDSLGNVANGSAVTFTYNSPSEGHAVDGSHD